MTNKASQTSFAQLVRDFFCERLISQRNASARTVSSYRDAFRLLLQYVDEHSTQSPADLSLGDIDAPLILDFLDHLERVRRNSVQTRNARLAAIRSFMKYVAFREPTHLPAVQRILAIPIKRFNRPLVVCLSREEMDAILAAPDCSTWTGKRDHVMFSVLYNTGARVSEIAAMQVCDVDLERKAAVLLHGKGRKERAIPLWSSTAKLLREWLRHRTNAHEAPVFPNREGRALSRSGVEQRLRVAVKVATRTCSTLARRQISPHTIRHTTAMHMLQAGIDITVIAMWLGHETIATTHQYIEVDLEMKERALAKLEQPSASAKRYRPSSALLSFLESL